MQNTSNDPNTERDPFGRIVSDDGSQDRFRSMSDISSLEAPVGPTDENRPDDVAKAEIMLDHVDLLDLRETEGPTGYFGERLRQAILAFQKHIGQPQTGRILPYDATHTLLRNSLKNTQSGFAQGPASKEAVHATALPAKNSTG